MFRSYLPRKPRRVLILGSGALQIGQAGELCPRVGLIVTNLSRPAERVTKFYDGRGTPEHPSEPFGESQLMLDRSVLSGYNRAAFRRNSGLAGP